MKPLRSLLFTPGNRPQMMEKACGSEADGIILDLEDSVPLAEKDIARPMVREALEKFTIGHNLFVRVNGMGTGLTEGDLETGISPSLSGIILPKAESAEEMRELDSLMGKIETERGIQLGSVEIIPLIESTMGVHAVYEILTAVERVGSVIFGGAEEGDLVADLGCIWSPEGTSLLYARSKVILEARVAGLDFPLDGVYMNLVDAEGIEREAKLARSLGYTGKTVIHPKQIGPVNNVFTPAKEEVDYASEVIEAFKEAEARGSAATSLRGRMIDYAMVLRAKRVLALAEAIEAL
jgi:citrate lyase subunit beta/citryl-CoA lyase